MASFIIQGSSGERHSLVRSEYFSSKLELRALGHKQNKFELEAKVIAD